jgi:hypothetical protein
MPGTITASRAFYWINIAGMIRQSNREITGFSLNGVHLAVGNNFDVQVPADLDQFW